LNKDCGLPASFRFSETFPASKQVTNMATMLPFGKKTIGNIVATLPPGDLFAGLPHLPPVHYTTTSGHLREESRGLYVIMHIN